MPAPPAFGAGDYQQALLNLLPRGRIWRRDLDSVLARTLGALAPTYARSTAAAADLLDDTRPNTTVNLLPEWEASLGLPDPCAGISPTFEQRRDQVAARWGGRGGQSAAYFVGYAASLGFTITVTSFAPARFGIARFGDLMLGNEWAHIWQINAPLRTVVVAKFGLSEFGEAYQSWGNAVLECEMNAIRPAHTVLLFHYVGAGGSSPLGVFTLGYDVLG